MYTTAAAVRLFVRLMDSPNRRTLLEPAEIEVGDLLVDLGVCSMERMTVHHISGLSLTDQWLRPTELALIVWRELQQNFEELLYAARKAGDERLRLQRQRRLFGDRTNDR